MTSSSEGPAKSSATTLRPCVSALVTTGVENRTPFSEGFFTTSIAFHRSRRARSPKLPA